MYAQWRNTRGLVNCQFVGPAGAALVAQEWRFLAQPDTLLTVTDTASATTWAGSVVVSGAVRVIGTVDGEVDTASTTITVLALDWSGKSPLRIPLQPTNDDTLPPRPRKDADLGVTNLWSADLTGSQIRAINAGPNKNMAYFADLPVEYHATVTINTELAVNSLFWQRHPLQRGGGYCSRDDIVGVVLSEVLRHEGIPPNPRSHTGLFKMYVDQHYDPALAESFAGQSETTVLRSKAYSDSIYDEAAHAAAMADSIPSMLAQVPCEIRYF